MQNIDVVALLSKQFIRKVSKSNFEPLFKEHIWKLGDYLWDSSMNNMSFDLSWIGLLNESIHLSWIGLYEWILIWIEKPLSSYDIILIKFCLVLKALISEVFLRPNVYFKYQIQSNVQIFRFSFLLRNTFLNLISLKHNCINFI